MHHFEGNIEIVLKNTTVKKPMDLENMLLRGSRLCKTDWVFGLVIYAGEDTKIRMNANQNVKSKCSVMEKQITNRIVYFQFVTILVLAFIAVLFHLYFHDIFDKDHSYIPKHTLAPGLNYFTYFILLNPL
jgi:magnesium-transporting ATPase (P-type)